MHTYVCAMRVITNAYICVCDGGVHRVQSSRISRQKVPQMAGFLDKRSPNGEWPA